MQHKEVRAGTKKTSMPLITSCNLDFTDRSTKSSSLSINNCLIKDITNWTIPRTKTIIKIHKMILPRIDNFVNSIKYELIRVIIP